MKGVPSLLIKFSLGDNKDSEHQRRFFFTQSLWSFSLRLSVKGMKHWRYVGFICLKLAENSQWLSIFLRVQNFGTKARPLQCELWARNSKRQCKLLNRRKRGGYQYAFLFPCYHIIVAGSNLRQRWKEWSYVGFNLNIFSTGLCLQ